MKRAIRAAAWFYPRRWRKRYGDEFEALLEDAQGDWRSLADVFLEAIKMRFTHWGFGRITLASAIAGAVIAAAVSFTLPDRWESSAVIRLTGADPATLQQMLVLVESRRVLTTMINSFDLYPAERQRKPMEDVIEAMKEQILVRPIGPNGDPAFAVRFVYEDRHKAQNVTRDLVGRLIDANRTVARPVNAMRLEIIDPPTLPQRPLSPNHAMWTGTGLLAGVFGGILLALAVRMRRRSHGICPTCGRPMTATA